MNDKPDFWDQAVSARPDSSWPALALNLICWTALYALDLAWVLSGRSGNLYAILGIALFLIPIAHVLRSVARKLRPR